MGFSYVQLTISFPHCKWGKVLRQRNTLLYFSQGKEQQGLEREHPVLATNPITGGSLLPGEFGSLEEAVGWKQRINKVTCNSYWAEVFTQLNEIKIGMPSILKQ